MNTDDLHSVLVERASIVGDDVYVPLDRVHGRIGSSRRRRVVAAASFSAGLIAVTAAVALTVPDSGTQSGGPSDRQRSGPTPAFTLVDPAADGSIPLPAGRYGLTADGSDSSPLAVIDVPKGFHGFGGWSLGADGGPNNQDFYGVSYHAVAAVPEDGCTRDDAPQDAGTSRRTLPPPSRHRR